ncbi:hypothetical protein SESBI_00977 [Sesbania bispinosa]|nr:hypothetical protein SESBI_00977 [Sesbania bispinosa]
MSVLLFKCPNRLLNRKKDNKRSEGGVKHTSSTLMSSARVSCGSSGEKSSDGGLTVQEEDLLDRSKKKPIVAVDGGGKVSHTTTGLGLESKIISYKDICIGVNGTMLTAMEREAIQIPWKRSIIVKLLGRKMGLKYFQARLYKLWRPKFRMELFNAGNLVSKQGEIRFQICCSSGGFCGGGPAQVVIMQAIIGERCLHNDDVPNFEDASKCMVEIPPECPGPIKHVSHVERTKSARHEEDGPILNRKSKMGLNLRSQGTSEMGPAEVVEVFNCRPPDDERESTPVATHNLDSADVSSLEEESLSGTTSDN